MLLPNEDYNVPLRFDVIGDGVTFLPLRLDWDLSQSDDLLISGERFNNQSFFIGLFQVMQLDRPLRAVLAAKEGQQWALVARWPKGLMPNNGQLEAINRSGKVLWKREVQPKDLEDWQTTLSTWKTRLKLKPQDDVSNRILFNTNLGILDFNKTEQPFWELQEAFRLCLSAELDSGLMSRMCSRFLETTDVKGLGIRFNPVARTAEAARVIAFNEAAQLRDSKEVELGKPVQFFAELASGASYEFIAKPWRFNVAEMIAVDSGQVKLTGWGPKPSGLVKELKTQDLGVLEKMIGTWWSQTIGDQRQFWETRFDRAHPNVGIPGEGGGLFVQNFTIAKLPTEKHRPYLRKKSLAVTYVDGTKFFGKASPGLRVSSSMNSMRTLTDGSGEFQWNFGAKSKGVENRSYILVNDGKDTFRAYREIYRGYPGEVSGRLSGIYDSGGSVLLMGELATSYWFESLFGWSNSLLSRDRWGVSAKYFQSINPLVLGPFTDNLTYTDVDLRYRFSPGLWSRDETWGMEFSYSQVSFTPFQFAEVGGGLFWARSMPKVFDDLMDLVPLFRYPKWVDMEFKYYPMTLTSTITPLNLGSGYGNWQLNFHGKIMWTKTFFGELGFGIKEIDVVRSQVTNFLANQQEMQLTSFYGTMGLGLSF